jgi:hypothetical protein
MIKYYLLFLSVVIGQSASAQALVSFSPTSGMSGKDFGSYLAIDNHDILVSSIPDSGTPGKVYAFHNENGMVQTAVFYPDDALVTDGFGQSLSVSNDLIAIGSPYHNASDGAVYTYKKNSGNWEFLQKIIPSNVNPGDNFGTAVKIFGEYLFITAIADETDGEANTSNRGSVSVYKWSGSQWEFSQKLFAPMAHVFMMGWDTHLGRRIELFNNNQLWIFSNFCIYRFTPEDDNWTYQGYTEYRGIDMSTVDFCLQENTQLTIFNSPSASMWLNNSSYVNDAWELESYIEVEYFGEENAYQVPTKLAAIGDKVFVGSDYYYEDQPQRKFPIRYYRLIDNQFVFQTMLYGNGPDNTDDYFGSVMKTSGDYAVIGAPKEGTGKAYTMNATLLSKDSFSKSDVKLYPNPTSGIVKITGNTVFTKAEVFNVTGKLLLSQDAGQREVSLEKFASGIYFIKLQSENGDLETFKIIKN